MLVLCPGDLGDMLVSMVCTCCMDNRSYVSACEASDQDGRP